MMKFAKLTSSFLVASAVICLTSNSQAGFGYSTTFDINNVSPNSNQYQAGSLSGSPTADGILWQTNDPDTGNTYAGAEFVGQADMVGFLNGGATNGWGGIGGRGFTVPASNTIYVDRPLSLTDFNQLKFDVDFKLFRNSQPSTYGDDTFGWTLFEGNVEKLALTFVPVSATNLNVFYSVAGVPVVTPIASVSYNFTSHLTVTISPTGLLGVKIDALQALSDVATSIVDPELITRVAATQILQNTTTDGLSGAKVNAGDNQMIFDNYTVVPEPSTVGLAIVAGIGGLITMIRRKAKLS